MVDVRTLAREVPKSMRRDVATAWELWLWIAGCVLIATVASLLGDD
jgi:hypothetical protein